TPTGFIPKYEDLVRLFEKELDTNYSKEDYELQFMFSMPQLLDKLDIADKYFRGETSAVPKEIFEVIDSQRKLLIEAQEHYGEKISPFRFEDYKMPEALTKPF
ncbi:MAG: hypothetical protein JRF37_06040, partial [Deltaproteobacteria bacterium]|nr:hypothetical protein [Deltaproteobacteria bacterium]